MEKDKTYERLSRTTKPYIDCREFFGYPQSWRSDFADRLDPTQPNGINQNRAGRLTYPETPFVRLSVLDQINHYWNDQNVYLHLRIGTNPNIIGKSPKISINKMIYAMRKIYQKHGLGVVIKSFVANSDLFRISNKELEISVLTNKIAYS